MSYFLGMEVHQNHHEIFICQQKYECKPTSTPMNQKEKFCKEDDIVAQSTAEAEYIAAAAAAANQALWIRN
ncbi:hypothetical protein AAG906_035316 [Vitis piasezkii]